MASPTKPACPQRRIISNGIIISPREKAESNVWISTEKYGVRRGGRLYFSSTEHHFRETVHNSFAGCNLIKLG